MRYYFKQAAIFMFLCMATSYLFSESVLRSQLAGSWYSGSKEALDSEIKNFMKNVDKKQTSENVLALILPHAGYKYSGQCAAYGINQIKGKKYSRVIVLGPSHRAAMLNCVSVPSATKYSTPLGEVELDTVFIKKLEKHPLFKNFPMAHKYEHSVQIEVPFLQYALRDFKLVPIVVGQLDAKTIKTTADILLSMIDKDTLIVASSDFTHYGSDYRYVPFSENIPGNLKNMDMKTFSFIEKKDSKGFFGFLGKTGCTVCGRFPIAILLSMLPEKSKVTLLDYYTSGKLTGSYSNSVSYMSIMFTGNWKDKTMYDNKKEKEATDLLSSNDKALLLQLARKTLEYYLKNGKEPSPEELGIKITPGMKQVMGAFVTLHKDGRLRGCIGEIVPSRPLYKAVMAQAVNSGLRDWRFSQVTEKELPSIDFEISALSPSRPVDSYKDIVIGKNGMTIFKNGRSAVFLPQVAPEQGWDIAETLTHLSVKAGLPPDAWKQGAKFTVFEAIVFGEKDAHKKQD